MRGGRLAFIFPKEGEAFLLTTKGEKSGHEKSDEDRTTNVEKKRRGGSFDKYIGREGEKRHRDLQET